MSATAIRSTDRITAADGTTLHDRWGSALTVEWCAEAEYVDLAAEVISLRASAQQTDAALARAAGLGLRDLALADLTKTHSTRLTALAVEYETTANRLLAALAAKRGTTVAEQSEALKARVDGRAGAR